MILLALSVSFLVVLLPVLVHLANTLLFALKNGTNAVKIYGFLHANPAPLSRLGLLTPKFLFTKLLQFRNPFSRTLPGLTVESLKVMTEKDNKAFGWCEATMEYQWQRVGNPFQSVHAAALILFAETVSGLSVFAAMYHHDEKKPKVRAIVGGIRAKYEAKAKTKLRATCRVPVEPFSGKKDSEALDTLVEITDTDGKRVCQVWVEWTVSPAPPSTSGKKSN